MLDDRSINIHFLIIEDTDDEPYMDVDYDLEHVEMPGALIALIPKPGLVDGVIGINSETGNEFLEIRIPKSMVSIISAVVESSDYMCEGCEEHEELSERLFPASFNGHVSDYMGDIELAG